MSTARSPKRQRTKDHDSTSSLSKGATLPSKRTSTTMGPGSTAHTVNTSIPIHGKHQQGVTGQAQDQDQNEDWTSSSGSDSDSDSDGINITTTTTTTRSTLPASALPTDPTIHTRLTSFFSTLAEQRANPAPTQQPEKLEIDSDSGFEEDDVEGEGGDGEGGSRGRYIELDLALGVLSEKGSDDEGEDGVGVGKGGIKVPGMNGGNDDDGDIESGSESNSEGAGLAELTNVAAGESAGSKRKTRRQDQKRKIEELG